MTLKAKSAQAAEIEESIHNIVGLESIFWGVTNFLGPIKLIILPTWGVVGYKEFNILVGFLVKMSHEKIFLKILILIIIVDVKKYF